MTGAEIDRRTPTAVLRRTAQVVRRLLRPEPTVVRVEVPVTRPLNLSTGSVRPDELAALRRWVPRAVAGGGPIVEIGTLFGQTTVRLALLAAPSTKVITVDNYSWNPAGLTPAEHRELTAAVLLYPRERGEVQVVDMGKDEFFRGYAGPQPALIFLDADHTYEETRKDIAWAVSTGCRMIAGHDYGPDFPGVIRAVDEAGGVADREGTVWLLDR